MRVTHLCSCAGLIFCGLLAWGCSTREATHGASVSERPRAFVAPSIIVGRVIDNAGNPVLDAEVTLRPKAVDLLRPAKLGTTQLTATDSLGRFLFQIEQTSGPCAIEVHGDGFAGSACISLPAKKELTIVAHGPFAMAHGN